MSSAYVPCNATVARWFEARRGLAVGLGLSGASAGTFAGPPLVALLIAEVGWRRSYALLGVGLALSLGLLAGLFVRDPRDRGLSPYGAASRPVSATAAADGWPIRRVVRHPSFALLVAVYTTTWIPVFMPPVHLVPLARDLGLSPVVGATALSALGAGSLVGRLGMGAVSDAIGRRPTLVIALGLQMLSFVGLGRGLRSRDPLRRGGRVRLRLWRDLGPHAGGRHGLLRPRARRQPGGADLRPRGPGRGSRPGPRRVALRHDRAPTWPRSGSAPA